MYMRDGLGLGQPTVFRPDRVSENKLIDEQFAKGTAEKDITNQVFWLRHPEWKGRRLPSCAEMNQLFHEWRSIQAVVSTKGSLRGLKLP